MDACHTYLHLDISVALKSAGIDLQRYKSARNADSLHHQSAHDREISVFKFSLTRVRESWNHSHDRRILYFHKNGNLVPSIIPCYSFFYRKWWKIGRRDYEVCSAFDGAVVWKIPVKLHFPGSTEKLAVYILLVYWHHSVLDCMQLCDTRVYMKHTSTIWEELNWRQANRLTINETKQSQSDYISLDFIKSKAIMWQR